MRNGEDLETSAPPIYNCHIRYIIEAYSKYDTAEAAARRFVAVGAWQAAGRAAEIAWASMASLKWDNHFGQAFITLPQQKVCKAKSVACMPGKSQFECWYLGFADMLF